MSARLRSAALVLLLPLLLAACGGIGQIDFSSTTIGSEGGVVQSDDGQATAAVPAGALDEETAVTLEKDGDGYVLGPEGTTFDGPVTVTVGGVDEGDTVGVDDPVVSPDPDGGLQVTGTVTETGRIPVRNGDVSARIAPRSVTAMVEESFMARAEVAVRFTGDRNPAFAAMQRIEAVAQGSVSVIASRWRGSGVNKAGDAIHGMVELYYQCSGAGRHRYGAQLALDDGHTVTWMLGTVDCVAPAELPPTGLDGEDFEPPTDVRTDDPDITLWDPDMVGEDGILWDKAKLVPSLLAEPGTALTEGGNLVVRMTPATSRASVDQSFSTTIDLWELSEIIGFGRQLRVNLDLVSRGGNVLPETPQMVVQLGGQEPKMGLSAQWLCLSPGTDRIGVHIEALYPNGQRFASEHLLGTAECVAEGSGNTLIGKLGQGDDEGEQPEEDETLIEQDPPGPKPTFIGLPDGGVAFPGEHTLEGGTVVRARPVAFTASPGESVSVDFEIHAGDLQAGESAFLGVLPILGEGNALLSHNSVQHRIAKGGAVEIVTVSFSCVNEGVQSYGVKVWLDSARFDDSGRVTREPAAATEQAVLLGTGLCAPGFSDGIPVGGWFDTFQHGDSAGDEVSLPATLSGPCTGRAVIPGHATIDPGASGGVYRVPRSGTASYTGSINAPAGLRTHSGSVLLHLPPPLPAVTIGSWQGEGEETSKSGESSWDFNPNVVPSGVLLAVSGRHHDTAGICTATVLVRIDGSSPHAAASLAFTLFALGLFGWAGLPKP